MVFLFLSRRCCRIKSFNTLPLEAVVSAKNRQESKPCANDSFGSKIQSFAAGFLVEPRCFQYLIATIIHREGLSAVDFMSR
jgi:hypothetical protein